MHDIRESREQIHDDDTESAAHIRLREDHSNSDAAALLIMMCGGTPCIPAAGIVYRFPTTLNRDEVLILVRSTMGWTIAEPFDGLPWLPGEPEARYAESPGSGGVFDSHLREKVREVALHG
jgi:hypothetical protein